MYYVVSCGLSHLYKKKIMDIQKKERSGDALLRVYNEELAWGFS